jgi:photosystem II stability/assembly factor-like uncharacterized protein
VKLLRAWSIVLCGFVAATLALDAPAFAATKDKDKSKSDAAASDKKEKTFSDQFPGLEFRLVGPYRGGRVTAVTGVRHQPLVFYFGATGGGIWKTTDGGSNWEPISDKDFKTGSIGAVAVSESDPNVIYVGAGEEPIRGNVSHGDGVYKSTDGGATWKNVGLGDSRQIGRIRIHPTNPDIVYVAAQGHVFGPNEERGIYRSNDGGKTWKRVLFVDAKTGASDLAMDPNNPRILYAGFWQVVRHPWEIVSGGAGSGLYKSSDGGDTWTKLTDKENSEGLPDEMLGKVGVAVSAAKPGRVFAMIEAKKKGGLYVSDDGGKKWTHVNDEHKIRERAWYYMWVYPDPKNANVVYLPNVDMHKSIDGGKSFADMSVPHGDNHDLWIDPDDPDRMILGNDGGTTITFNGGRTWSTQDNQPTAQFYRVATDNRFPYWLYGAQQDNSTVGIPSGTADIGIGVTDWYPVGGGEAGWIAPDPKDPEIVYAGDYFGLITRHDHHTRQERDVTAWPQLQAGKPPSEFKYRFQWNAPIYFSPHDPQLLYYASQKLLASRDGGENWTEISPDLTTNDKSKQGDDGGPITKDNVGVDVYCTIFAISESPVEKGVIWTGSDDGLVHVTRDGGKNWDNVTPKSLPAYIQINAIDASPHEKGTAWVAATMYKWDDFRPYIYKVTDYGKTWTKLVTGIPDTAFTRVVREDPKRAGLLFAGTETGLYVSFDGGAHWQAFQRNLPYVPITDLQFKNDDLVVATQGRAFWILDDIAPLQKWSDSVANETVRLFPPRPAVRMQTGSVPPEYEEQATRGLGKNIPNGVLIDYWLKEKPKEKEKVTIEILADGKVIRSFSNEKKEKEGDLKEQAEKAEQEPEREKPLEVKAGMNRFLWDMRMFRPTLIPRAVFNEGTKEAPKVTPGTYQVRLTAAGQTLTENFEVRPHPGLKVNTADLKAQYDMLADIRDRLSETHTTVLKIRDMRRQVKDISDRAERLGKGDALKKQGDALAGKLTAVEEKLINPQIKANEDDLNYTPRLDHDLTNLAAVVASADAKPTTASVQYYEDLKGRLSAVLAEFKQIQDHDVAEFNRSVDTTGLARVVAAPKVEATP